MKNYYTVSDIERMLNVKRQTVYRWIKDKQIGHELIPGRHNRYRFTFDHILRFAEQNMPDTFERLKNEVE
jgi:excisionase family DNA binding protein